MDKIVTDIDEVSGMGGETIRMVLGIFLTYPLGLIMSTLPYGKVKHAFAFLLGVFLLQFTLSEQWFHLFFSSSVAYLLLLVLPTSAARSVVPAFAMLYCVAGHLHGTYFHYMHWRLDFTGAQMVLTIKLYTLIWNISDGKRLAAKEWEKKGKEMPRDLQFMNNKCSELSLTSVPGPLEYFGYCLNFSNVLAGPAYEFKTYEEACSGVLLTRNNKNKLPPPSRLVPFLVPFTWSIVCMATKVLVSDQWFPIMSKEETSLPVILRWCNHPNPVMRDLLINPAENGVCATDATTYPVAQVALSLWLTRLAYQWVAMSFTRFKYYFAWKSAEAANNLWYAGFQGYDEKTGKEKGWENSCNASIPEIEAGSSLQVCTNKWNQKTANWLMRYIYIRTNGSLNQLVTTYGISAFWHGFYPGYYLFFLSMPLMQSCERLGRERLSPLVVKSNSKVVQIVYHALCIFATIGGLSYNAIPFMTLSAEWSFKAWRNNFFFGHVLQLLFYGVVSVALPPPPKKDKKDMKDKKA